MNLSALKNGIPTSLMTKKIIEKLRMHLAAYLTFNDFGAVSYCLIMFQECEKSIVRFFACNDGFVASGS